VKCYKPMNRERIIQHLEKSDSFHVHHFKEIDSTNSYLYREAKKQLPDWSVAIAEKQTAGKGRFTRKWESPPGVGLWFSFLLHPRLKAEQLNLINILVAYTIATVLEEEIFRKRQNPVKLWLKWPNDILYQNKKLCGILLEGNFVQQKINYVVAGIGLNVNQDESDFSPELRSIATSLRLITNSLWDRDLLLARLLNALQDNYEHFLPDRPAELVKLYRQKVLFLGKRIRVAMQNKVLEGIFKEITEEGYLVLEIEKQDTLITTGDIFKIEKNGQIAS